MIAARLPQQCTSQRSRIVGVLLIGILLIGCATEFFYSRLDTLASWYFEDLVSLSDDQRHELRDWLQRTLAWHRQSELRRYSAFVSELSNEVATPGDRSRYQELRARFASYLADLVGKTSAEASRLLLSLSASQTQEMLHSLTEKAAERRDKSARAVASNKWPQQQREDFAKQLKRWTGSVSDAQASIIANGVQQLEPTYLDWAASQRAWRDALQNALAEDHSATGTQQAVQALLSHPQQHWTPPYAQKIERNRDRYLTMLVAIDASLSAAQRTRLQTELRKLAGQLEQLAENSQ